MTSPLLRAAAVAWVTDPGPFLRQRDPYVTLAAITYPNDTREN